MKSIDEFIQSVTFTTLFIIRRRWRLRSNFLIEKIFWCIEAGGKAFKASIFNRLEDLKKVFKKLNKYQYFSVYENGYQSTVELY